ncbi:MAG: hypothetical protein KBD94_06875 [Pyrinomonadaceae bacterium]|nr:hypothetical protein [Pyrinomonadaceae bacterium]
MKLIGIVAIVFSLASASAFAQSGQSQPPATQRVIVTSTLPPIKPPVKPVAAPTAAPRPLATPVIVVPSSPAGAPISQASNLNYKGLSFAQIKSKLAEAKRYLATRPMTIGSTVSIVPTSIIRVAFYDDRTRQIDSYVLTKEQFLAHGASTMVISSAGKQLVSRTIRGNGVNTPVVITDQAGHEHMPLMVQYPRESRGVLQEMAYYVSSHPKMITPEVVSAGRFYVRNVIDMARDQLKRKGYSIQPKVADIAERLSTVEHVDHLRFRTEPHANIYNDIFTLYALNEGQTYRYSVSSAGAGGMVQMIPSTYRMVRAHHPNAALMPDFVEGMRNHVNAAQAMLLYMQMTWNDLIASPTVYNALQTKIATQEQLMAAGYNSNPAKLAGYINRAGASWTILIPRETKVYLQIWDSLERHVTLSPRKM